MSKHLLLFNALLPFLRRFLGTEFLIIFVNSKFIDNFNLLFLNRKFLFLKIIKQNFAIFSCLICLCNLLNARANKR